MCLPSFLNAQLSVFRELVIHENADMEVEARHTNMQFVQRR